VLRLKNKIALVTGAARGIGQAVAEQMAAEGALVIVTDTNDHDGKSVAQRIGSNAEFHHLDVTRESEWESLSEDVLQRFGHLDILVNNAGITGLTETSGPHDPENLDMDSWRRVHSVNIDGAALGCKYAIRLMRASAAASIINISSRSGIVGIPTAAAYASSKAALRNHTKSVALYCAQKSYPIRCNSLHPGAILTPIWDAMLGEGQQRDKAIKALSADIPLGTMGKPIDVAYAAVYLASDESGYVTGSEINIDGGILAGSKAAPSTQKD
jgi:3(or 17)beta-hydroxysteroid dehydrogenase